MKKLVYNLKIIRYVLACKKCGTRTEKMMAELSPNEDPTKERDHRGFCYVCKKIARWKQISPPEQS